MGKDKYIKKVTIPLLKQLQDHLQPLTPDTGDDCKPSINLSVDRMSLERAFPTKSGEKFLKKLLSMDMASIYKLLDSDKRVQGFSFEFDDSIVQAGLGIVNKINKTNDPGSSLADGEDLFAQVYYDPSQVDHSKLGIDMLDIMNKGNKK